MCPPSEKLALLPKAAPSSDKLRARLKKAAGADGKIEKSEFKVVLLGLGIRIKQAVLEEIFAACDADGDGVLTIDEIMDYVDASDPHKATFGEAVAYTAQKATSSLVWWFAVAFHFAALVGIVSFFYTVAGKKIRPEWSLVGAWFFFFGAVYFFKLLVDYESSSYDTFHQAEIILKKSVDDDPTFFDQKAAKDSTMHLHELNAVLEEQALYVPEKTVKKIFEEIDTDQNGYISKEEILEFAKTFVTDGTEEERQQAIKDAVVHTWGFWSLLCWFIGSILFLVGAHLSYAGYKEPPLPKNTYLHLYGIGSVMYFLLAVCMLPTMHNEVKDYLESVEQMRKAFAHKRESFGGKTADDDAFFKGLSFRSENGDLDVMELFEVLLEEGVLIPYDTLLELFKSADTNGDGLLQFDEFKHFIKSMKVENAPWQYRLQMIKRFPFTLSFFGWLMFFIGGIFFIIGSYVDVANSTYWYFYGAVCYGAASGKNVFGTLRNHYRHYYAVEAGTAEFKARISADREDQIA